MHFSSLDVRRGERFSGSSSPSTNVASIEVRTNLVLDRRAAHGAGPFRLRSSTSWTRRRSSFAPYRLRVIARNSAGAEFEQDLPFEIR